MRWESNSDLLKQAPNTGPLPVKAHGVAPANTRNDCRVPIPKGCVVDRYRFGQLIGSGGFSLVYQGIDLGSQKHVVIKEYFPKDTAVRGSHHFLRPKSSPSKTRHFQIGLKQFFEEARMLAKVSHPHVVQTTNIFRANQTAYLVSEGCTGRDLKWFLKTTRRAMEHDLLIKIFMPILSGLDHLHRAGLVHLDVKPANLLLRAENGAQLLDFGAAQPIEMPNRANHLQTLTHGFAPPEQYDKKAVLGPWSDIYAAAATMFFCMSYRLPKKSKGSKIRSHLDPDQYQKYYPLSLIKAVNNALELDASKRYPHISDFATTLLSETPWQDLEDYEQKVLGIKRDEMLFEPDDSVLFGRTDKVA